MSDTSTLGMMTLQDRMVLVVLPEDRSFLDEIRLSLQIEEFMRKDMGSTITKYDAIKEAKTVELRERNEAARRLLEASLQEATIYAQGEILTIKSKDIAIRMNEAIGKLVLNVYNKLYYIDTAMNEKDIETLFTTKTGQLTLDGIDQTPNKYALDDVKNYIATNTQRHIKTSMKSVIDRFLKAPYGFIEDDVHWLVAKLFKEGDLALFVNNEAVTIHSKSVNEIILYLTRKANYERLMLETRERANEKQKKVVKEVMREMFGVNHANDDAIMNSFLEHAGKLYENLDTLHNHCSEEPKYPGKEVVSYGKKLITSLRAIKYSKEFFDMINNQKDEYLDFAEDYTPVKGFFEGDQKKIFDRALKLIEIYNASKTFIVNSELEKAVDDINTILKNRNPFGQIFKLPDLLDKFNTLYDAVLEENLKPVELAIQEDRNSVLDTLKGKLCFDVFQTRVIKEFEELKNKADTSNNVANLQSIKLESDVLKVRFLNEIEDKESKLLASQQPIQPETIEDARGTSVTQPVIPVKRRKSISTINTTSTWQIETEEDVKKYIQVLEKKLISSLEENTVINIEF